jgi:hypothetical protein
MALPDCGVDATAGLMYLCDSVGINIYIYARTPCDTRSVRVAFSPFLDRFQMDQSDMTKKSRSVSDPSVHSMHSPRSTVLTSTVSS